LSAKVTSSTSLKDISCPSYGNVDLEVDAAIGKEWDIGDDLRLRAWGYAALGHANRGSPWVRGIVSFETNIEEEHKLAFYAVGTNGYGRHTRINTDHFYGYAKIREKTVDLGIRYGYQLGVFGTLRFGYERRLLAKSCPSGVNSFLFGYLLPFSL
jgi:hypothetical protein